MGFLPLAYLRVTGVGSVLHTLSRTGTRVTRSESGLSASFKVDYSRFEWIRVGSVLHTYRRVRVGSVLHTLLL